MVRVTHVTVLTLFFASMTLRAEETQVPQTAVSRLSFQDVFSPTGFAFQLSGSIPALSRKNPSIQGQLAHEHFSLVIQPEFDMESKYGGFSVGPFLRFTTDGKSRPAYEPSYGGTLRYSFEYVPAQLLVPTVGYIVEASRPSSYADWFIVHNPFAGVSVLLNRADAKAAEMIHDNAGIRKTYLVAEVHFPYEDEPPTRYLNITTHIGLRLKW